MSELSSLILTAFWMSIVGCGFLYFNFLAYHYSCVDTKTKYGFQNSLSFAFIFGFILVLSILLKLKGIS